MQLKIILFIGFLSAGLFSYAQNEAIFEPCDPELLCRDFQKILDSTRYYLSLEKGGLAYGQLKALEACDKCPEHQDDLDELSDQIIKIFREQNESLNDLVAEQKATLTALQKRTEDLRRERKKVDQQLVINEKMTRDALVTNYLRLANKYYAEDTDIEREEARWLTDFVYNYVDSTHHEVRKMMHQLLNDQLLKYYDYDPDGDEEQYNYEEVEVAKIVAVAWSPDEQWLAVGMDNGRLIIFSESGEIVFDQDLSEASISDLDWNKDSEVLAFVVGVGSVNFLQASASGWSLTDRVLSSFDRASIVRWSPVVADELIVATLDNVLHLYKNEEVTPELIYVDGHDDWIRDVAWSPDGTRFVACDDQGYIVIWQAHTGKIAYRRRGHNDYVRTVDWHPEGHTVISGGDDNQLIFWDTLGQIINKLTFDEWVYQARFDATGEDIGVVTNSNTFFRVTADDRKATKLPDLVNRFAWRGDRNTVEIGDGLVLSMQLPAKYLVTDGSDRNLALPNIENAALQPGSITQIDWSPDAAFLAYVKDDRLEIVDAEKITSFDLDETEIYSIAWNTSLSETLPNSVFFATVGSNYQLLIWDASTLTIVHRELLEVKARDVVWSPDGELLAIVNDNGELLVYNNELQKLHQEKITNDFIRAVDWSANGRILMGSDDNSVVIYDWDKKRVTERFSTHTDWVRDVLWLDNTHFVSAADDGKSIIWGLGGRENRYQPQQILDRLSGFHLSLAYSSSRSGGMLAVGNNNNDIGIWKMSEAFNAQFDTLVSIGTQVHDLDWHPTSGNLALSTYSSGPQELNRSFTLQPAYDTPQKEVIFKNLEEALGRNEGGMTSFFYLPKFRVTPGRYDQLAWSEDEQFIAAIEGPGRNEQYNHLVVHDLKAGQLLYEFSLPNENISRVLFSPDNSYLVVAPQEGACTVLMIKHPEDTIRVSLEQEIMDWVWSGNGRYLAILDRDYDITLFDSKTKTIKNYSSSISDYDLGTLLFHPKNDELLYILSHQGVYEVSTRQDTKARNIYQATSFTRADEGVGAARGVWINNGSDLLYLQKGTAPKLLNIQNGKAELKYTIGDPENYYSWVGAPANLLYELHPMDDDEYYFNGNELEYARAWGLATGKPISILRGVRKQLVQEMKLSPDGKYLATLGDLLLPSEGKYERGPSSVSIWDLTSQNEVFDLRTSGIKQLAFSPKGNYLYTYFENGQVGIWPLFTPQINNYFANSGKDRYLEQLSSKDNQPLRNRIEEWELEKGINFQEQANLKLLKTREIARIRQNWGEYYVDQAWLSSNSQTAAALFDKAISLHLQEGTNLIRPSAIDSIAIVNIWIEQAYYKLNQEDERAAKQALRQALRIQPEAKRLKMLQLLLDWQAGQKEKVVEALLAGEVLTLLEEYANWDRRDIHLIDELLFQRLTSVVQSSPDPVSPISTPRFAEEIQIFPEALQEQLLLMYYKVNTEHPALDGDGKRQAYYDEAVAFFDKRWEKTQQEESSLENYIIFNYYLQDLEIRKDKSNRAVATVGKGRKGAEQLLLIDPENVEYKELYLNILAEEAFVNLRANPANASKVKEALLAAREKYPQVEMPYLLLELANAKLLLGQRNEALLDYYHLLESYSYGGVENLILEQVELLMRSDYAWLQTTLQTYRTYQEEKRDFWESVIPFEEPDLETSTAEYINEAYWMAYQSAKEWYGSALALDKAGMLPKDSLLQHELAFNQATSDYVYILLHTSSWEDAQQPLKDMQELLSQYRWPIAVEAVLAALKDDWPTARNRLNQVAKLPNDGIRKEDYPTFQAFLLDLPEAVKQHTNFQKRSEQWNNSLRN